MYPWMVSLLMLLVVWTTLLQSSSTSRPRISSLVASAAAASSSSSLTDSLTHVSCTPSATTTTTCSETSVVRKLYRTVQVQIVHRHGDRTPITPLRNPDVWETELISTSSLAPLKRISSLTKVLRDESFTHKASGQGPFGKLTKLGFEQMVDLGRRLRRDLVRETHSHHNDHQHDHQHQNQHVVEDEHGHGWHPHVIGDGDLHPHHVHIFSTDFERTLQSVQGVLAGLFPNLVDHPPPPHGDNTTAAPVFTIDARHTPWMIPDPQPRATQEQTELEQQLADQPHWVQQEEELRPLAIRATLALKDLLADGAMDVTFGVAEAHRPTKNVTAFVNKNTAPTTPKPLSWAQLAEITKCLRVRNMLPPSISAKDQDTISNHLAQRWFGLLRHPRLSYLAMNRMASLMIQRMQQVQQQQHGSSSPPIIIYSAHDSTLIGLMCAFRLEQPTEWPEYGSYLKLELIEEVASSTPAGASSPTNRQEPKYWVRFSLNSQPLQSQWEHDPTDGPLLSSSSSSSWQSDNKYLIPLEVLAHYVTHAGSKPYHSVASLE